MKKLTIAALLLAGAGTITLGTMAQGQGGKERGKMMMEADVNQDGNLTKAELEAHKAAKKAERFASADTNGDNLITFEEFEAQAEAQKAKRQAERRERMFARLDADSDGYVTMAEMDAAKGKRGDRGEKMFDRIDTDGDGVLTEAEREAAKEARAERRGKRGEGRKEMRRNSQE